MVLEYHLEGRIK
jgi:hypothetical protein